MGLKRPTFGVFEMGNVLVGQSNREPLNVIDQDNLNTFFGQNGISNTLDRDTVGLLRLNELQDGSTLTKDATFGILELSANDSLKNLLVAGGNIQAISAYQSICADMQGEADKSRMSLNDYGLSGAASSAFREMERELLAISSDSSLGNTFTDFKDKYDTFKLDQSEITQYVVSKINSSPEDQVLGIKNEYKALSDGFYEQFDTNLSGLYLNLSHLGGSNSLQSDFKLHTKTLSDAVEAAQTGPVESIDNQIEKSFENSF